MSEDGEWKDETFVVQTPDGNVHVVPATVFDDWVSGESDISDTDDWEQLVRTITREWAMVIRSKTRVESRCLSCLSGEN